MQFLSMLISSHMENDIIIFIYFIFYLFFI